MYSIFEQLLQKEGVTTYKVSKETGIPQQTFSKWKKGLSVPKADKLMKIAEFFGVSVEYLMGKETNTTESIDEQLSHEEFALFGEVHDLTDEEKQRVLDFIKFTKSQRKDD